MTPGAQRIAIAEACGWKRDDLDKWSDWLRAEQQHQNAEITDEEWMRRHLRVELVEPPDYLNDLNAMHEAEKVFDKDGIASHEALRYQYSGYIYGDLVPKSVQPFRATASQRAEAFLKTIGKWDDSK